LPEDLKVDLRENSSRVVLENSSLASTMGMVFPRQPLTALAYTQTYVFAAENHFENYLCVKEKIMRDKEIYGRYEKSLEVLDQGYKFQNTNFVLLHIKRKRHFETFFDPSKKPQNCDPAPLLFYPKNKN
jgi:transposase-like protein